MYQALYRKYRPKKFEDVYGQNVIVQTLKNTIKYQHINHAYLFSGPRGTGKTTIAKIFACAVNCLNAIDGEACGECENCKNSFSKECIDIIEIDAASNNGVDEIRELKSKVNIVPSELKYKIYIIDEVHMLSIGAFNALLKTLEEPPEHAIFILATTDPQKVPVTIVSRCQCYQFKRIDDNSMLDRLSDIVKKEKLEVEEDVLKQIVAAADGGLRDAVGLLDQVTSYKTGLITSQDFNEIYGNVMESDLDQLLSSIFTNDASHVMRWIEEKCQEGKNIIQIVKQLMQKIKNQLCAFYVENKALEYDEEICIQLMNKLNEQLFDMKKAEDVKTYVEIFLLNFMHNVIKKDTQQLPSISVEPKTPIVESPVQENNRDVKQQKEESQESQELQEPPIKKQEVVSPVHSSPATDNTQLIQSMITQAHNVLATASKSELLTIKECWNKLSDFTFDNHIGYIVCYLMDGKLCAANEEKLILSYEYTSMLEKIFPSLEQMTENFNKITSLQKKIVIITDEEWKKLKTEFITCKQKGIPFETIEEVEFVMPPKENAPQEEISSIERTKEEETLSLFGDIVEIQ